MMVKLEKVFLQITRFFIFAALAAPIISSVAFLFPYMGPAVYVFQLCVASATLSLCLLLIINPAYRPPINKLTLAATGFVVIQILLTFASIDPARSFLGSIERMDGAWQMINYWLFSMVIFSVFRNTEDIKKLIIFSLAISAIVSLRYFVFYAGPSFAYARYPLGNPGFLANYILLHIPLAFWVLITSKSRESKIFLGIFIAIQSGIAIHTANRAVFLGLAVFLLLSTIYFSTQYRKIRLILITSLILAVVGFGILLTQRNNPAIKNIYFLNKITDWSFRSETVQSRIIIWKIALRGIEEKPIFGWGRENFNYLFSKNYDPEFYNVSSSEHWIDRAHNIFLDELASGGIVGALAGVSLIVLFSLCLLGAIKKASVPEQRHSFAVFLIFIIMYFVQMLFTLQTMGAYLPLLLTFSLSTMDIYGTSVVANQSAPKKINHKRLIAFTCVGMVIILASVKLTFIPALASNYAGKAIVSIPNNFPEFQRATNKVDSLLSGNDTIRSEITMFEGMGLDSAANKNITDSRIVDFQNHLLPKLKIASQTHPYLTRLEGIYAFNLATKAQITLSKEDIKDAIVAWDEMLKKYPDTQVFLIVAGALYIMDGQVEHGLKLLRRVFELTSESPVLSWRGGLSLMEAFQYKEGLESLAKALKLNYSPSDTDLALAVAYANRLVGSAQTLSVARDLYFTLITAKPNNAALHMGMAYIYNKLGRKDLAQTEINTALKLANEQGQDISQLLQNVNKAE